MDNLTAHGVAMGREAFERQRRFVTDKRQCQNCAHYRPMNTWPPICTKHHMGVIPEMHVTYEVSEGTCWTSKRKKTQP